MSGYLGPRSARGAASATNPYLAGGWTVTFNPGALSIPTDFEVYHIALKGPGGNFYVHIDDAFYSTAPRGDVNEYDPVSPMYVRRGQTIYFYWETASGSAPQVWIWCQTPSLAKL